MLGGFRTSLARFIHLRRADKQSITHPQRICDPVRSPNALASNASTGFDNVDSFDAVPPPRHFEYLSHVPSDLPNIRSTNTQDVGPKLTFHSSGRSYLTRAHDSQSPLPPLLKMRQNLKGWIRRTFLPLPSHINSGEMASYFDTMEGDAQSAWERPRVSPTAAHGVLLSATLTSLGSPITPRLYVPSPTPVPDTPDSIPYDFWAGGSVASLRFMIECYQLEYDSSPNSRSCHDSSDFGGSRTTSQLSIASTWQTQLEAMQEDESIKPTSYGQHDGGESPLSVTSSLEAVLHLSHEPKSLMTNERHPRSPTSNIPFPVLESTSSVVLADMASEASLNPTCPCFQCSRQRMVDVGLI